MHKLVILGGGESGYGTAVLAKKEGWDVFLSDNGELSLQYKQELIKWGISFEEGKHTEELILDADEVVKSPGIPDSVPIVRKLKALGTHIISEIEFAYRYTSARTICVTGSNGKTTTASLIYRMLKDAGFNVGVGGNIGDSFAYQVATQRHDWYVIELSSFQLDGMFEFKADIGVLMNITPDHLDRYDHDMNRYIDSKMRIIQNQRYDDFFIFCEDDENIMSQLPKRELPMRLLPFGVKNHDEQVHIPGHKHSKWHGAHISGDDFYAVVGERKFVMSLSEIKIQGIHNTYNAMAATMAAMASGVSSESIRKTLSEFEGVEHRLEYVGEIAGVEYINDSKATNVDSVWYALESMKRPVVWIAGGTDKGNDYAALKELAAEKVKVLIALGVDNAKIKDAFKGAIPKIYDTHTLTDAMAVAKQVAINGDVVLLSPACASFDLFNDYIDRGNQFKEWVVRHK